MNLDEAIKHCLEVAEGNDLATGTYELLAENNHNAYEKLTAEANSSKCAECAADHRQLAEWLKELKELREQIQKAKAMLLDSSYTVDVMCNKISGTIGCEKCTYYNPETHDCEVRAYISKTRVFVKGDEAQ